MDNGGLDGPLLPCTPIAMSPGQLVALRGILQAIENRAEDEPYTAARVSPPTAEASAAVSIQAKARGRMARSSGSQHADGNTVTSHHN